MNGARRPWNSANVGVGLQYNPTEAGGAQPLLRDFLSRRSEEPAAQPIAA